MKNFDLIPTSKTTKQPAKRGNWGAIDAYLVAHLLLALIIAIPLLWGAR